MTLQQLHYFVMTAELHSFTRAAEACHVSQPALSHAISELEDELGTRLFLRTGRAIQLTETGELCLQTAREIERAAGEMASIAARREEPTEIAVGYVVLGHLNAYLSHQARCVPREFLKEHRIVTVYDEITEIRKHLAEGKYDFIIIPAGNSRHLPPHDRVQISPDSLSLIVGRESPFFTRAEVSVRELAGTPFIFYPNNDELNGVYRALCLRNGFEPQVAGYGKKMGDIVSEVLQKRAAAFCSSTFAYLESPDIHIAQLRGDLSGFHLELVMLKANRNQAAAELFRYFRRCPADAAGES